jgi:cerevisin
MRAVLSLSILPLLASASPVLVDTIHNDAAPILSSSNAKELPNSYIIVFKKHVTDDVAAAHHSWVQDVHSEKQNIRTELRKRDQFPFSDTIFEGFKHTYNIAGGFLGYSGHFDDGTIEQVRRHPDVSTMSLPCQKSAELTLLIRLTISSVTRKLILWPNHRLRATPLGV